MSIAYGFDPNISPILSENSDQSIDLTENHSVHFSSADTPKTVGKPSTRKKQRDVELRAEISSFHVNLDETIPESDEVVPDSNEENQYLWSTKIVISAGCCKAIQIHLASELKTMGANIQDEVDDETTHLVVDRYSNEETIEMAMKRRKGAPIMVDIKWIQDCIDQRRRINERDYSMTDCQYLKKTCKRLSSANNTKDGQYLDDDSNIRDVSLSNPTKFLKQVKRLYDRMDKLLNYVPIIRYAYHSPECPTRQRVPIPTNLDIEAIRNQLEKSSTGIDIKRRRSFQGYGYQHRMQEDDDVWRIIQESRDTRETWQLEKKKRKRKNPVKEINIVNDGRKTIPVDLPTMRKTIQRNADINRSRAGKAKTKQNKENKKPEIITLDDSDIQSAMASLTISESSITTKRAHKAPLVVTKSNYINRLLMRDSRDDFVSDVSDMNRSISPDRRTGVVFTGFAKESEVERRLKKLARKFKLQVLDEIDERNTRCVVSRHGQRTLLVLKAIVCDIPIVNPIWLEESEEDSRLLPWEAYQFPDWRACLKKREKNKDLFGSVRRIFVSDDCQPPKADLCRLIGKCGGMLTANFDKASLIVSPDLMCIDRFIPIVKPIFILDSITDNQYLSRHNYQLNSKSDYL